MTDDSKTAADSIAAHNQHAWDAQVQQGNRWTLPVDAAAVARARSGSVEIVLTPNKPVPSEWLGSLQDRRVLCLASGGGQQGPLLAAAGAQVTVFDLSAQQLAQDRAVAEREGLSITLEQGDMRDLSRFADGSFELIVHPVSNCFIDDIQPVWRDCHRVLQSGGRLLSGFTNPILYLFDPEKEQQGQLIVRHRMPYVDTDVYTPEEHRKHFGETAPYEFGHSLTDQIGGQLRAGFILIDMYEDEESLDKPDRLASQHFAPFIATCADKRAASPF